jgi:hypothetical protein
VKLTPPPFDTELGAVLQTMAAEGSTFPDLTAEGLAAARHMLDTSVPDDELLSHQGFFEVEDRVVPGPEGDPDISLLICRPAARSGLRPRSTQRPAARDLPRPRRRHGDR